MPVWSNLFTRKKDEARRVKWTFGVMLCFGITGLIAAFTLAVEEFILMKHPDAILSCSFNLVFNCATVMKTWQASVFGFPNMYIGLMSFPVVIAVALAGLSGTRFARGYLITAQIFYTLGALFAYWLFFNSVYDIQVLCPWCLVVTVSTTMLLASMTHYNLMQNTFKLSKSANARVQTFLENDYDKVVTAIWLVFLVALVILKFGDALIS